MVARSWIVRVSAVVAFIVAMAHTVAAQTKVAYTPTPAAKAAFKEGVAALKKDPAAAVIAFKRAIEADPDYIDAHMKYSEAVRAVVEKREKLTSDDWQRTFALAGPEIRKQYTEWMAKYPTKASFPFRMGQLWGEHPNAEQFFRRAVELEPTNSDAWLHLSLHSEMRGNNEESTERLRRATEGHPEDPSFAAYYVFKLMKGPDYERTKQVAMEFVNRFPREDRAAQVLYWLAYDAPTVTERISLLEQLKTRLPPNKFGWSTRGMSMLFDTYNQVDPTKALALAKEMVATITNSGDAKQWKSWLTFEESFVRGQALLVQGDAKGASDVLAGLALPKYLHLTAAPLELARARAMDGSGNTRAAYDTLIARVASRPNDSLYAAAMRYGAKLSKTSTQVDADVAIVHEARATVPTAFSLKTYGSDSTVSLASLRGKVVLVTFWYPGCGPCRGEYPHFQAALEKYGSRGFVLVGINGVPDQDDMVLSFLNGNRYTFIPLRVPDEKWAETNYGVSGYPSNFLIDKDGKVIYKSFMIGDREEQRMLDLMIEGLLAKEQTTLN